MSNTSFAMSRGQPIEHSGRYSSAHCPTIGCSGKRTVRAQLDWPDGRRRVVTACERCIDWYVARAVMRLVAMRGQDAVRAHVDGC